MKPTTIRNPYDAERASLMDWTVDHGITLDNVPATIGGRAEPYATVTALDGSLRRAEFAWPTVRRIVHTARATGTVPNFRTRPA